MQTVRVAFCTESNPNGYIAPAVMVNPALVILVTIAAAMLQRSDATIGIYAFLCPLRDLLNLIAQVIVAAEEFDVGVPVMALLSAQKTVVNVVFFNVKIFISRAAGAALPLVSFLLAQS